MKNRAYYVIAVPSLVAVVTTFNYGCGGVEEAGAVACLLYPLLQTASHQNLFHLLSYLGRII